jgi:hypothetical protein
VQHSIPTNAGKARAASRCSKPRDARSGGHGFFQEDCVSRLTVNYRDNSLRLLKVIFLNILIAAGQSNAGKPTSKKLGGWHLPKSDLGLIPDSLQGNRYQEIQNRTVGEPSSIQHRRQLSTVYGRRDLTRAYLVSAFTNFFNVPRLHF